MISYRQHVMTLVAVFLALAVGVVLGGGPLSDTDEVAPASARAPRADAAADSGFADDFAAEAAPSLYADRLTGTPVALVTTPGADDDAVTGLGDQLEAAGARVTARYDLRERLLDPGSSSLVDTLGSQLLAEVGKGAADADASAYVRMGQLLGLGIASPAAAGTPADGDASAVRQSLAGADMLTASDQQADRAPLVLVVLGDGSDPDVLGGLLSGVSASAAGVVVAGSTASGRDGDLAALRAESVADEVTTVDGVESVLGQVTAVLATARALDGDGGEFGASGAEGAVPVG